jgi:hypothetical protein
MYMRDWVKKLDDFLRLNERDILNHAGRISAQLGDEIAHREFEKYWEHQKQTEGGPVNALEDSIQKAQTQRRKKNP